MTDRLAPLRRAPGLVRLHGHRGARGVLPENTLLGFCHTFDIGVQVVELDILATADGVPVITHNPRLMAASTRDPQGIWLTEDGPRIHDLALSELQSYDIGGLRAGSDYAGRYPEQAFLNGQHVPTLDALATLVADPALSHIWLNIEIKSSPDDPESTPPLKDYVAAVIRVLRAHDLMDRVILQSFDWRVLEIIRDKAPELPRSYLSFLPKPGAPFSANVFQGSQWLGEAEFEAGPGAVPRLVAHLGGKVWAPFHRDITPEDVDLAHDLGLIVNAWTVNTPEDIHAAINAGVDGLITDYPARAQRLLLDRGLSWREDVTPAPE